jgi:hypothetical protein
VNVSTNGAPEPAPAPRLPGRKLKWAISICLALHLAAVVVAPASTAPSSELLGSAWEFFRPYLQFFYINHGHHFFAPEPAESTLLAYVAEREDGSIIRGRIPTKDIVPRLLYHRHFMLTEHMNQAPEELQQLWYRSYAEHVGHKFGASKVSLTKITHWFPSIEHVQEGRKLDEASLYEEQPLGVFQCDAY